MFDPTVLLILVVVLALAFDFSNGWHDSANAIATVVSTHVLSPGRAVFMAAVLNIAGAFMSTAVAKMIGGGIVEASMIQETTVIAALSGAIAWNLFTLILGLPTSSSHALIGGIIGGALAQSGMAAVKLSGLQKVLEAMLLSPLVGFVLGYLLILVTYRVMFRVPRGAANR
ncbi:MAG: inorganic phosphate transporter, partial [Nitrospirota bacterium]